ncbi:unnamed protein product [Amoebophrya sp. A120]|nr:unnamed protein product [Amoebophrya sp. A120]|eukprot:GSA120T00004084001.1
MARRSRIFWPAASATFCGVAAGGVPPPDAKSFFDDWKTAGTRGFDTKEGQEYLEEWYARDACVYQPNPGMGSPPMVQVCDRAAMISALQQYPKEQWKTMKLMEGAQFAVGPLLEEGKMTDPEKPLFGQWSWCLESPLPGASGCYHQAFVYKYSPDAKKWKITADFAVLHGGLTIADKSPTGSVTAPVAMPPELYKDVFLVLEAFDGKTWGKLLKDAYAPDAYTTIPLPAAGSEDWSLQVLSNKKGEILDFFAPFDGVGSAFRRGTVLFSETPKGSTAPAVAMWYGCLEHLRGPKKWQIYEDPALGPPCFIDIFFVQKNEEGKYKIVYEFQAPEPEVKLPPVKVVEAVPAPADTPEEHMKHMKHVVLTHGWDSKQGTELIENWYAPDACVYGYDKGSMVSFCGHEAILQSMFLYTPESFATMTAYPAPSRQGPYIGQAKGGYADPTKPFFLLYDWCTMGDSDRVCFHQYYIYEYSGSEEKSCSNGWQFKCDISIPMGFYKGDQKQQAVPKDISEFSKKWDNLHQKIDTIPKWGTFVDDVYADNSYNVFATPESPKEMTTLLGKIGMQSFFAPGISSGIAPSRFGSVAYGGGGAAPMIYVWYGCVTGKSGNADASKGYFDEPCFVDFQLFAPGKADEPLKVVFDMQDNAPAPESKDFKEVPLVALAGGNTAAHVAATASSTSTSSGASKIDAEAASRASQNLALAPKMKQLLVEKTESPASDNSGAIFSMWSFSTCLAWVAMAFVVASGVYGWKEARLTSNPDLEENLI